MKLKKLIATFEEFCIEHHVPLVKMALVKSVDETINTLQHEEKSIVRFGDGELELIKGADIPFQKASQKLSDRLKEVLSSSDNHILIALPHFIYSSKENLQDVPRNFWKKNGKRFRDTIRKYISLRNMYYAAEFTIACDAYKQFDKEKYFSEVQKIWENKNITIICGKTVFDKIEHNIFDNARSVEYLHAPSLNAFDGYDEILKSALSIDKNRLIVVILGPTGKVLTYDLAKYGYRALDLGNIAKSYDWYCKGKDTLQMKDAIDFFNPD